MRRPRSTRGRSAFFVAAAIVVLALAAYWASRPQRVAAFVVSRAGSALGLEIHAGGVNEYFLRDGARLVLRDVVAREPGATNPLLRAARIDIALPWSTLRSGGSDLRIQRVELDAPVLDLPALQRWLSGRPPSEQRLPTLTRGLRVRDGSVAGDGWRIDAIAIDLAELRAGHPLRARVRGRYLDPSTRMPFDLALALARPARAAGAAVVGDIAVEGAGWRLPTRLQVSGPLRINEEGLRITPMRLSASARYRDAAADLPFTIGLHGPLRFEGGVLALNPAGIALRGESPVPDLDAHGGISIEKHLAVRLQGRLAAWPGGWPALPPPLGASPSPLPFALDYAGATGLGDVMRLRLGKDDARFDARFRLPDVLAWTRATDASPLPPLQGRFTAPRLEVSGAMLEGVDVRIDEPAVEPALP